MENNGKGWSVMYYVLYTEEHIFAFDAALNECTDNGSATATHVGRYL